MVDELKESIHTSVIPAWVYFLHILKCWTHAWLQAVRYRKFEKTIGINSLLANVKLKVYSISTNESNQPTQWIHFRIPWFHHRRYGCICANVRVLWIAVCILFGSRSNSGQLDIRFYSACCVLNSFVLHSMNHDCPFCRNQKRERKRKTTTMLRLQVKWTVKK